MKFFLGIALVCGAVFFAVTYFKTEDDNSGVATASFGGGGGNADGPKTENNILKDQSSPPGTTVQWPRDRTETARVPSSIVIGDARMLPLDRQEVPSERDGQLLVIGTEVGPNDKVPDDRKIVATVGYMIVWDAALNTWRNYRDGDKAEPKMVPLQTLRKTF